MNHFLSEFKSESLEIAKQMAIILEECEADPLRKSGLSDFALLADRIMGAAMQMGSQGLGDGRVETIAQYAQVCKMLGYKGAQLPDNAPLYPVLIAFLLDATEALTAALDGDELGESLVTKTFLERLEWVNGQFAKDVSGSVPIHRQLASEPPEIQILIDKLKSKKTDS